MYNVRDGYDPVASLNARVGVTWLLADMVLEQNLVGSNFKDKKIEIPASRVFPKPDYFNRSPA